MEDADTYAKCLANSLGDCEGPMSREHIFSNATSRKDSKIPLAVKWMVNMPNRTIGFDGPTARILCQSHNCRLSILDSEATKLADGFHKLVDGGKHTTVQVNEPLLSAGRSRHSSISLRQDWLTRRSGRLHLLRLDGYEPPLSIGRKATKHRRNDLSARPRLVPTYAPRFRPMGPGSTSRESEGHPAARR